ncbi:MarP family serine protease [Streptomyces carpaticus]|uniref:Colicin V production protein n=2 Tax=Streptomyces TaxID=1883 RepID=A0A1I6TCC8_9ACTN|nr:MULTISPECIES: MarP family serine protease [Streptomyces]MCK1816145.1 MarP family serine protease [Streptomyces sp. XM4011]QKV69563.1 MarP family serine protease [Streptomyces harbinensis]UWM49963.1 MarP family serine protease [Streptomyces carpaticus]SFS86830.1 Colicin V production protein [Streptomyces harbinensis]
MNTLDVLLLLAAVWFAVVGYRQGFVVGILSVAGFLGGGLIALYALPRIWSRISDGAEPGPIGVIVAVVVVIVCACSGQALTTHYGNRLRRHITWSPARALDATGGALVNVLAMLVVAWLIGSALAITTLPTLGREVRSSRVLLGVERVMPLDASSWMNDFSAILAQHGLPQVFSPFATEPITEVDPPDPALAGSPVVEQAAASIVRVSGTAPSCGKVLEGSGFVFAEDKVMTNAHVVGGVGEPTVQIRGEGRLYDGRVVLYDWESDVAILDVPGLDAPPLEFSDRDALTGDDAIVAGFPESGPFDVRPARVRERFTANGPDIYRRGTVNRDVYSLYSTVRQGNSGGPLLTPEGEVYGLVFAKSLDDDSTGYALTLDEIADAIERGSGATAPVDTQNCAM